MARSLLIVRPSHRERPPVVSVTSEVATSLSFQAAPQRSARAEPSQGSADFGALVDNNNTVAAVSNNSNGTTSAAPLPSAGPRRPDDAPTTNNNNNKAYRTRPPPTRQPTALRAIPTPPQHRFPAPTTPRMRGPMQSSHPRQAPTLRRPGPRIHRPSSHLPTIALRAIRTSPASRVPRR